MKKITALLLSSVLLLIAIFVAIPLSAVAADTEPTPIEATPLVMDSVANGDSATFTLSDVTSATFTSVKGTKITLNSGKDFYSVDGNGRGKYAATFTPVANTTVTPDETHFMFRYEANGASSICFKIVWAGSWLYLNSGATVEVLKDGATQWETKTATTDATPQIAFDEAFSGYIKFSYLANSILPSSSRTIEKMDFYTYGMGAVGENTYATEMTVGPFFTVTSDSTSTKINVPDEFKPLPIEAVPLIIDNISVGDAVTAADADPLSFTSVIGKRITLNSGKDFYGVNSEGRGSNGFRFDMDGEATVKTGDTHFMFRFETNGKATFSPMVVVSGSWYNLKSGATVEVLKDGDAQWKTLNTTDTTKPQIQFDGAFSGYIKIAYSNFDYGGVPTNIDRPMTRVDIYTYGMGTVGENTYANEMTVGPFFSVTSNSTSTVINVPDEFKPQPVEVKPLASSSAVVSSALAESVAIADSKSLSSAFENGKTFTLNSGKDFYAVNSNGRGTYGFTFYPTENLTIDMGETHLMFHFKSNGPATISPLLVSGSNWFYLTKSSTVQVLEDGDTNWSTLTTSSDEWSQIEFNKAFSGLVKIAYTDLNVTFYGDITSRPVTRIDIYTHGMGTVEEKVNATEMSVGAFYSVSSDSISTEINIDTVDGDVNVDGLVNTNDLNAVRNYMLRGTESKYLDEYGNLSGTDNVVDILDLVKIAALV